MKRASKAELRAMAACVMAMIEAMPELMLPALDVIVGATQPGRGAALLIVGGEVGRLSFVVAQGDHVGHTVEAFDQAFANVPGPKWQEVADAKSTH